MNKMGFLHPNNFLYFWLMDSPRIIMVSKPRLQSNRDKKGGGVIQHDFGIKFEYLFRSVKQYQRHAPLMRQV